MIICDGLLSFSFQALLWIFWFFPLEGAFVGKVDFSDLEANLFFAVLYLVGSIVLTLRHDFNFCSALTSMGSIVLTLRHDYFLQCADFNRVDFVDPEARF